MNHKIAFVYFLTCFFLANLSGQRSDYFRMLVDGPFYEEGIVALPVSSKLEFVSFYGYLEQYKRYNGQLLNVEVYAPSSDYFLLKAEEKKVFANYWLESKPDTLAEGKNVLTPWQVDRVLSLKNITPNNLGILTRFGSDESKYFLPVVIYHSERPEELQQFKATFRIGKTISGGEFKVYKGEHHGVLPEAPDQSGIIGINLAGATFDILIDREILKEYEGWVTVKLVAQSWGQQNKDAYDFFFYHSLEQK